MVQDTSASPEMYLSKLEGNKCGGWGIAEEAPSGDLEYSYTDLQECTVVWAVSVPGENQWSSEDDDDTTALSNGACATRHFRENIFYHEQKGHLMRFRDSLCCISFPYQMPHT
jgi:hypothetical protein